MLLSVRGLTIIPVVLAAVIFVPLPFAWLLYFSNPPRHAVRSPQEASRAPVATKQTEEPAAPESGSAREKLNIPPLTADEAKLTLYRHIDAGISYTALKKALPGLSSLQHEAYGGLTEAFLEIRILDFPAQVEFNFKDRRLYNFFYIFHTGIDTEKSERLLRTLTQYLSNHFDQYREESYQEEANYHVKRMIWSNGDTNATVTRSTSAGSDVIVLSFDRIHQGENNK